MKISEELDKEIARLDMEGAVSEDVLIEIFKALEEKTTSSKDIKEVTKQISSLRERIEKEGTSDRKQLSALVKDLISEIRDKPEPIKRLDVKVENPVEEVTFKNKTLSIKGKVETKEGSKTTTAVKALTTPLKGIGKKLGEILRVKIIDSGDPRKPVAVRLSDGKKFYNAIFQAMSTSGWHVPFKKSNGVAKEALVDDDGRQIIRIGAEDIDNLGVIELVQGQFNSDGFFELLTAGSGGAGDDDALLMDSGDYILMDSGDKILLD